MDKKTCIIKKYPILIGFFAIILLILIIVGYREFQAKEAFNPQYTTEKQNREATIDGFTEPNQIIEYIMTAVQEQDLDKFLRGCAIDEVALKSNMEKFIEKKGVFGIYTALAPSMNYNFYFPLASSELTNYYSEIFESMITNLEEPKQMKIDGIHFVLPSSENESEYKLMMQRETEMWGAEAICEMYAEYTVDQKSYATQFTLINYYGYWKLFGISSESLGSGIYELENQDISDKVEDGKEKEYNKYLKGLYEEKYEKLEETDNINDIKNELLIPNYFLLNTVYGETPREVIEKFTLYLEKGDLMSAMAYGGVSEEKKLAKIIEDQNSFAVQIKSVLYSILEISIEREETSLEELGATASQIIKDLDPQYIKYMDLMGIKKVSESQDTEEYVAVYRYAQKYYLLGFTLVSHDGGWKILSLSSKTENLEKGEVQQISQVKMEQLLQ